MERYSVFHASLDRRGVWGRMDTCICMAESLCCSPETTTTFFKVNLFILIEGSLLYNIVVMKLPQHC